MEVCREVQLGNCIMKLVMGDYVLRPVCKDDLPMLLMWRNSDRIRSKMLQQHIISWEEHLAWFERIKEKIPPMNFTFEYLGEAVGYGAISECDFEKGSCSSGKYIGEPDKSPIEAGIVLTYMIDAYIYEILKMNFTVDSTLRDNKKVLRQNLTGGNIIKEEDNVVWIYHDKKNWEKNKETIGRFIDDELVYEP